MSLSQISPSPKYHIQSDNAFSREVLLGITGKDFTLIAASKAAMRGATILKAEDNKTRQLNKHTLMAYSGEAGDTGKTAQSVAYPFSLPYGIPNIRC